jgi:uncharacterized protein (DUF1499 family)
MITGVLCMAGRLTGAASLIRVKADPRTDACLEAVSLTIADGVAMKALAPCPSSPNCVSTQASDHNRRMAPFRFQQRLAGAQETLKTIISRMPRTKLVEETEGYLHYEFTSLLLRFVDDVEFVFDEGAKLVQFRSASRTGYSDLGVNRRRMEEIRSLVEGNL